MVPRLGANDIPVSRPGLHRERVEECAAIMGDVGRFWDTLADLFVFAGLRGKTD